MITSYYISVQVWCVIIISIIIFISFLCYYFINVNRQVTDLRIHEIVNQYEETSHCHSLINNAKSASEKSHLLNELSHIFRERVSVLKSTYPQLTDLDMQVIVLIGLDVPTQDILTFTDMSKRTYYKRRQLIAKRMDTTAAQLDAILIPLFNKPL